MSDNPEPTPAPKGTPPMPFKPSDISPSDLFDAPPAPNPEPAPAPNPAPEPVPAPKPDDLNPPPKPDDIPAPEPIIDLASLLADPEPEPAPAPDADPDPTDLPSILRKQ